jgi:hypothetical protein
MLNDNMVLKYKSLVEEEVDFYTHDEGVLTTIKANGNLDKELGEREYDEIEDYIKDQLLNKGMYEYLLEIAKKEKDKENAKNKVDDELERLILEALEFFDVQ